MGTRPAATTPTLFPAEEQLNRDDAITITGSRQFSAINTDELFNSALSGFVGRNRVWLLGGALGIDQAATDWLLNKSEHVIAVVPFTINDQPQAVQSTLAKVRQCVELHYRKTKKAYLDRNAFMVEHSSTVIAFWNGEKGGTWATVQHALKLHKQVHVYPL